MELDGAAAERLLVQLVTAFAGFGDHHPWDGGSGLLDGVPVPGSGAGSGGPDGEVLIREGQFVKLGLEAGLTGYGGRGGGRVQRADLAVAFRSAVADDMSVRDRGPAAIWKMHSFGVKLQRRSMLRVPGTYEAAVRALVSLAAKRYCAPAAAERVAAMCQQEAARAQADAAASRGQAEAEWASRLARTRRGLAAWLDGSGDGGPDPSGYAAAGGAALAGGGSSAPPVASGRVQSGPGAATALPHRGPSSGGAADSDSERSSADDVEEQRAVPADLITPDLAVRVMVLRHLLPLGMRMGLILWLTA
ncbi:hypothetical protein FNF29_07898 [Cafeteria roenbergensis]|uniref:Uncharacterized protein n=1 Tax=Cafeteria roenbergensis TaxID=33653 RepID=A0A5A8C0Y0_CAFRO|nr:hypothetical protein FNF29_07898 [Cafeteria roenbergensis]|eukprot:KAA0146656.1 hypothetical protein FNF29_07898 [Cafeteria roenbergensis]